MSNPKTAINEIKKLMVQFGFISDEKVKEVFVSAKLVDGTEIRVEGDSLVEGAKVVVITPDAEIPAPDGVHELEDGTKVETKDGIIAMIEKVAEADLVEVPEMSKEKMEEVPVEVASEIVPLAGPIIDAIVEAISPVLEEVKSLTDEMKKMKGQFEAFKKEPAAKKIGDRKTDFSAQVEDALDARIKSLKSLKNNK